MKDQYQFQHEVGLDFTYLRFFLIISLNNDTSNIDDKWTPLSSSWDHFPSDLSFTQNCKHKISGIELQAGVVSALIE